jgi:hypothetical protein
MTDRSRGIRRLLYSMIGKQYFIIRDWDNYNAAGKIDLE